MSKRSYSDEEKANALLALDANGGNLSRTSREAGIPIMTLVRWRDDPKPWLTQIRNGKRKPLADLLEETARLLIEGIPAKAAEASARDAAVSAAVLLDKMRLLREQPTTITRTEETSDAERADRILELLGSGGESGTRPPPQPAVH